MIPNERDRELISGGITASGDFGISDKDAVHLMTILRDTLYTDKVLAVLREYASNAWDANRMAGKPNLPIDVTLPTVEEPTLCIRDHGPGLSKQDVFEVYTQYGASTKRESDISVGCMGIGSKAGFAYSDTFMVTSWHGGSKCIYVAVLDTTNMGKINLIHEEPCEEAETGVEIQISVNEDDFDNFRNTAQQLFQHFEPQPNINIDLPDVSADRIRLPSGILDTSKGSWYALMGCVTYKIDVEQLANAPNVVHRAGGILFFNIGDVAISASREELKYTDTTKDHVIAKFESLIEEFITKTLKELEGCSDWGKRLRLSDLRDLALNIPGSKDDDNDEHDNNRSFTARSVNIEGIKSYATFYATWRSGYQRRRETLYSIAVSDKTQLVIKNDRRAMDGFKFESNQCLVVLLGDKSISDVTKALHIDGIPIVKLSDIPWSTPVNTRGAINIKHRVRSFVLETLNGVRKPLSNNWSVIDRVPTDEDVYVILDSFSVHDFSFRGLDFYDTYLKDKILADHYGLAMPAVYGYKTTMNKVVSPADCKGVPYAKWHEEFVAKLLTIDKLCKELDDAYWLNNSYVSYRDSTAPLGLKNVISVLGRQHPVASFYIKQVTKRKKLSRDWSIKNSLNSLFRAASTTFKDYKSEFAQTAEAIRKEYPLLDSSATRSLMDGSGDAEAWLQYIQAIDFFNAAQSEVRKSA